MKRPSRLSVAAVAAVSLAAAGLLAAAGAVEPGRAVAKRSGWKDVERLEGEQKIEEARAAVEGIRKAARASGDQDEWTRALIREVQLRIALHGYETAVRFLRDEPWPDAFLDRTALDLFYAHSLVTYSRAYGWEIGKREKVESKGAVDLKAWTLDQIRAEAARAYLEIWRGRDRLSSEPVARLKDFIDPNTYPEGIRPTLRDAVTYLAVDFLADSSGWRPEEANEVYRLDAALLAKGEPGGESLDLGDPSIHPLRKVSALLGDLAAWHARAGRREAELEALLERDRRLHSAFPEAGDRRSIRRDLERRLGAYRSLPWWAMGQAELADFVRSDGGRGNLVRARLLALEGAKAFPESAGGRRCRSIAASIEEPAWRVASMASDGRNRRSIQVTHRNVPRLHFRAFPVDLESHVAASTDYSALPDQREVLAMLQSRKAEVEWTAELPPTADFKDHRTYIVPPVPRPGLWVVVVSGRPDFGESNNQVTGVDLIVTDLVLTVLPDADGGVEVRAVSGASGRPAASVEVALWKKNWREKHQRVEAKTTGADGRVRFSMPPSLAGSNTFLLARKGDDVAYDEGYLPFTARAASNEVTASLVYTDRSAYRPQQTLFWKVLAYRGRPDEARYAAWPEASLTVTLVDPNGEAVEKKDVKTNGWGSAAGEFRIPAGRLLGSWNVQSSLGGTASVKVEEYKRPTFEVSFKDAAAPLRLNRPAVLPGEARYYFGLPVTAGAVKWRVTREPVFPWWWGWYGGWGARAKAQTIATGSAPLKEDGSFEVAFTPEADERSAGKDVSYRFAVSADVTDEGGETRSASRAVRLGAVSVEARIEIEGGFFPEASPASARVVRSSLDGVPRPGSGTFRLVRLAQPERSEAPADLPLPRRPAALAPEDGEEGMDAGDFETPGDRLRPRWETDVRPELLMREWKDGEEVARGRLDHGAKGDAVAAFGRLSPGAYRVRYETADDFGAKCEASAEFLVAGPKPPAAVPLILRVEKGSVPVGGTVRVLAASGIPDQALTLEVWRKGRLAELREIGPGSPAVVEIPVTEAERGGFGLGLSGVRDHQFFRTTASVVVPWDDRVLGVEFSTFRDRLRPGARETFSVKVRTPDGRPAEAGAAEVLAYMYDRSLDLFAPHNPPDTMSLYPVRTGAGWMRASLAQANVLWLRGSGRSLPGAPSFQPDRLKFTDSYGIGGPGRRGGLAGGAVPRQMAMEMQSAPAPAPMAAAKGKAMPESPVAADALKADAGNAPPGTADGPAPPVALRSDFAETAFWRPNLLTGPDGTATIEFTVPDSVTSWNVWVHAVTKDLKGGSLRKETRSVKDLMVRPYLPRFLREGDAAELKVVVNNASDAEAGGTVTLEVIDPATNEDLGAAFGLASPAAKPFRAPAGGGANVTFAVKAPRSVAAAAFRVTAVSGSASDGELRPVPVLPSRLHLVQSRFVTLKNRGTKEMTFADMARADDPTLTNEQLVVTVDAQLFYTVLEALPYLVDFPYECTEQTLNRFVSTGIVSSLYDRYPAVARMASELSRRTTPLETWDGADPNRKMALEESPWLVSARGGKDAGHGLTNVLDPRAAKANREASLAKLRKAQNANGSFPWWPGGPPSPYMTLYLMNGFAHAAEFGVDVPKDVIQRGWRYLASHYRDDLRKMLEKDCCWEFLTFLNYAASSYPDGTYTDGALTAAERKEILDFSFRHWKQHSPYLKGFLALTLKRAGRPADAKLVWDSVMDSSKTTDDQGTFWAPEDRSWLWYNDTVETQAFALRTLDELRPDDARREGLVQWLLLNKKLGQWKSTRATAEALYALAHYLRKEGALGVREDATVTVGPRKVTFTFEPDVYSGKKNQVVVPGAKVDPKTMSTVAVSKESPGFAFASAAWHFATDRLPAEDRGDFFSVSRTYFRREMAGKEWVLRPLAEGAAVRVGDQLEVHLSLRTKHEAEYVHLRDPRGAGFEPDSAVSRYRWDLGVSWYEEIRDSGTNFFFERLPVGEYAFSYRVRAATAGTFRVGPATVQSMYAPEFNAYSTGAVLSVKGD